MCGRRTFRHTYWTLHFICILITIAPFWPFSPWNSTNQLYWSRRLVCTTHGGVCKHSWPLLTILSSSSSCFLLTSDDFHPLQGYPGSWYSVYNLILTSLDDLCKQDSVMNIWLYININYSVNNGQVNAWTNFFRPPGPTLIPGLSSSFSPCFFNPLHGKLIFGIQHYFNPRDDYLMTIWCYNTVNFISSRPASVRWNLVPGLFIQKIPCYFEIKMDCVTYLRKAISCL